jgi:hypothetical protein
MNYVTKTPQNWARDDVLTGEILGALRSTAGRDFIYTISVQGHGSYPTQPPPEAYALTAAGFETEEESNAFAYYLRQIREMDDFLRTLTEELSDFGEDVILVLYGDHLPALDFGDADMRHGSSFETSYVIWSNFDLPKEDKDLEAYQLGADVETRLGVSEGVLMRYHQRRQGEDARYLADLRMLQYDLLYGKKYAAGGQSPAPTNLQMGYSPIRIYDVVLVGGEYYISGEGFTPFSKVSIGDTVLDTIFLGPTILKLMEEVDPDDAENMQVSQVEKNSEILSTTE